MFWQRSLQIWPWPFCVSFPYGTRILWSYRPSSWQWHEPTKWISCYRSRDNRPAKDSDFITLFPSSGSLVIALRLSWVFWPVGAASILSWNEAAVFLSIPADLCIIAAYDWDPAIVSCVMRMWLFKEASNLDLILCVASGFLLFMSILDKPSDFVDYASVQRVSSALGRMTSVVQCPIGLVHQEMNL